MTRAIRFTCVRCRNLYKLEEQDHLNPGFCYRCSDMDKPDLREGDALAGFGSFKP